MTAKKSTSTKKTTNTSHKSLVELRDFDKNELQTEIEVAHKDLYILKMKQQLGELKQTHQLKSQRRYIAQLNTFLTKAF